MISVTQVLSQYADFSRVSPEVLDLAAERGQIVHGIGAAYLLGVWAPRPQAELQGYVDSLKRWVDEYVEAVIAVEEELRDETLGIVGHPDLICRLKSHEGTSTVDFKTPAGPSMLHKIQVATYMNMAKTRWGFPLRLRKGGQRAIADPIREPHKLWIAFLGALNMYRILKEE